LRIISRLGARFTPRGRKRGSVLVAAPAGDRHGLPVAIVANLLRWRGFTVIELGADVPPEDLAKTASETPGLVAVGLACTFPEAISTARSTISALRGSLSAVTVFIGGRAITDAATAHDLGADYFSGSSGRDVVRVVDELMGLTTTVA